MNKREYFISIIIISLISTILIYIANDSYAFKYKNYDYSLFNNNNQEELTINIKKYIEEIDDYLIPNSSFIYSDILTENYDFLTNFALDYIINNRELYEDKIKEFPNFKYYNNYHQLVETNKYIDISEIYSITDKFFGIKNYHIINDNVNIIDNYISLSDYSSGQINNNITDIQLDNNSKYIEAIVTYDNSEKYKYTFKDVYNVLKIYNIEVVE